MIRTDSLDGRTSVYFKTRLCVMTENELINFSNLYKKLGLSFSVDPMRPSDFFFISGLRTFYSAILSCSVQMLQNFIG